MSISVIIPARGGSKGVPRKNLLPVGDIPLVGRSVKAALSVPKIGAVYVSTDSTEIADMAKKHGASVIMRPPELATDTAASEDALLHFADTIQSQTYVFLQCTSPFTTGKDIESAIEKFNETGVDSVLSVTPDHGGFLCGGFTWDEDGNSVNYDYSSRPRRQDMKKTYRENGAIYVMSREGLIASRNRLHGSVGLSEMPRVRSFEIDEPEDFSLANHHYSWLKAHGFIEW